MGCSFAMTRNEVVGTDPSVLRAAIVTAVGGEAGVDSIVRSLQRIGGDEDIRSFEVTEMRSGSRHGGATTASWRVRADRGNSDEGMAGE